MRRPALLAGAVLLLAGCRSAETVSPGSVTVPSAAVVPEGTPLGLRLEQMKEDVSALAGDFERVLNALP